MPDGHSTTVGRGALRKASGDPLHHEPAAPPVEMDAWLAAPPTPPPAARPDEPPSAWLRGWIVVILVMTLAAGIAAALALPLPLRPAVIVPFALLCPGMALIRLVRIPSHLGEVTLGIALSIAIDGLVAGALLYANAWSPAWTFTILVGITLVGLALDPLIVPRPAWGSIGRVLADRARLLAGVPAPAEGAAGAARARAEGQRGPASAAASADQPARRAPETPRTAPPARRGAPEDDDELPPPPVAVVHRRPAAAAKPVPPTKRRGRRVALGSDPLDNADIRRAHRNPIDQALDDLAKGREEDPS